MHALLWLWIGLIALLGLAQTAAAAALVRWLRRYQTPAMPENPDCPRAAVVLCLRGADPYLRECLERLERQEYPDYSLTIVLDSASDPAQRVVDEWLSASRSVAITVKYVRRISRDTSLKVNALRDAIAQLDSAVEVVVLVDADTLTHSGWLRQMVAPVLQPGIGVVSGNRWYSPTACCWGSLVRFIYNSFSVVPMQQMGAIWPGSLSMRRQVFTQPCFLDRMRDAACEDEAILAAMRQSGLGLAYAADCTMFNREECDLASCFRFIQRQLLWTRLSNPHWNRVLAATIGGYGTIVAGLLLAVQVAQRGGVGTSAAAGGAAAGLLAIHLVLLQWLHSAVTSRIETAGGIIPPPITMTARMRLAGALIMTLPLYVLATLSATFARRIQWRGITYRVGFPGHIRMLGYTPYDDAGPAGPTYSL